MKKNTELPADNYKNWHYKILLHLYKYETVYHVHFKDDFLKGTLGMSDNNGNDGRKLYNKLKELRDNNLIRLRLSDHGNLDIPINEDDNDNTSITINVYWFHAELTLLGMQYIGNYIRQGVEEKILKQNRNLSRTGIVIAFLTGVFIAMTAIIDYHDTTAQELQYIRQSLQEQVNTKQSNQANYPVYQSPSQKGTPKTDTTNKELTKTK